MHDTLCDKPVRGESSRRKVVHITTPYVNLPQVDFEPAQSPMIFEPTQPAKTMRLKRNKATHVRLEQLKFGERGAGLQGRTGANYTSVTARC